MDIRIAQKADLKPLLGLYAQLHNTTMPIFDKTAFVQRFD